MSRYPRMITRAVKAIRKGISETLTITENVVTTLVQTIFTEYVNIVDTIKVQIDNMSEAISVSDSESTGLIGSVSHSISIVYKLFLTVYESIVTTISVVMHITYQQAVSIAEALDIGLIMPTISHTISDKLRIQLMGFETLAHAIDLIYINIKKISESVSVTETINKLATKITQSYSIAENYFLSLSFGESLTHVSNLVEIRLRTISQGVNVSETINDIGTKIDLSFGISDTLDNISFIIRTKIDLSFGISDTLDNISFIIIETVPYSIQSILGIDKFTDSISIIDSVSDGLIGEQTYDIADSGIGHIDTPADPHGNVPYDDWSDHGNWTDHYDDWDDTHSDGGSHYDWDDWYDGGGYPVHPDYNQWSDHGNWDESHTNYSDYDDHTDAGWSDSPHSNWDDWTDGGGVHVDWSDTYEDWTDAL